MANLFFVLWLTFLVHYCFTSAHAFDTQTDRLSLLAFKEGITDDPLQVLTSWNGSVTFCKWRGIACTWPQNRVTILSLPFQKLGGSLSPAIANLTFLRVIDLQGNALGGLIPADIGRLSRLHSLSLMHNNFQGEIPANISRCLDIEVINLNYNNLSGRIPTELSGLPNLVALQLSANQLTGGIPRVLANISSLRNLSVAQNFLGGTIPDDLGRLANLEFLQVGGNNLSGTIPPSIFNLSRMSIFGVAVNRLEGNLPSTIGISFPNLEQIYVGLNGFSGMIPPSLSNASRLQVIDMSDSRFTGKVPADLGRLTNLSRLNIGRNLLGPDGLDFIDSLVNCSKLEFLGFDSNLFSGPLPSTVANLSINMNSLLLGGNQFSGSIPSGITRLINLMTLNVSWNRFDGPISPDIGNLSNLGQLYMNGNRLSGNIPSSIGNMTKLFQLRLDGNRLERSIPSTIGNCQQLQLLNLSSNNLSGAIPLQVFTLSSLTVSLNLARNSLKGTLPADIGNLVHLKELDLSDNKFSGSIPDSIGRCLNLERIYMQRNSLNGSVPSTLSALKGMQDLDLSRNNLSGRIPEVLQELVFLRHLNLSFNHFSGQVPKGGVFTNISAVSLSGNSGLCGGNQELELPVCPVTRGSKGRRMLYLKVAMGVIGGVFGSAALLFVAIFCMPKRWRRRKTWTDLPSQDWNSNFSYEELEKVTNGFSLDNLVGKGSFGSVYKGMLSKDRKVVAVKVLRVQEKGISKIYMAECEALRNIKHRNLVKVLGYCSDDRDSEGQDFRAIVLEFMPNGSLQKWLHPNERGIGVDNLSILRRLCIAIDVACALEYLHYDCPIPVAHCDLKPDNVLLDADLCAHLSDFGLAKFIRKRGDAAQSSSVGIRGSIGYVAPEYGMGGPVSISGDVYSFGILLLELFTGRRPTDERFREGLSLHKYAEAALSSGRITDVVDPILLPEITGTGGEKIEQCLAMIMRIGVGCSQGLPHHRMHMKDANINLHLIRHTLFGN